MVICLLFFPSFYLTTVGIETHHRKTLIGAAIPLKDSLFSSFVEFSNILSAKMVPVCRADWRTGGTFEGCTSLGVRGSKCVLWGISEILVFLRTEIH